MTLRVIDIEGEVQGIVFRPVYLTHQGAYGQTPNNYGSPYWAFSADYIPMSDSTNRAFEAELEDSEGINVFGVWDNSRPYPLQHHAAIMAGASESIVEEVRVKAMSRADSTLTLAVPTSQKLSVGDPVAFVDAFGINHYFRIAKGGNLTGQGMVSTQWLTVPVKIRPRFDLSGIDIPLVRIKPRCRFVVDLNDDPRQVGEGLIVKHVLEGIEYFGAIA